MIGLAQPQSSFELMALYNQSRQGSDDRQSLLPVGLLLCGATSVSSDSIEWPLDFCKATNTGLLNRLFKIHPPSTPVALKEIKSATGLTWQQLAKVFNVSPRSLHLWMGGETLDSSHQERLYQLLTISRRLPFVEPYQNRAFLLYPQENGTVPFDLLVACDDEAFISCANCASSNTIPTRSAGVDRQPLPPSVLMDASQETLHIDIPGRRTVKAVKRRGIEG